MADGQKRFLDAHKIMVRVLLRDDGTPRIWFRRSEILWFLLIWVLMLTLHMLFWFGVLQVPIVPWLECMYRPCLMKPS